MNTPSLQCRSTPVLPTKVSGPCIVCKRPGLLVSSWCYGCGSFCCTTHDHRLPRGRHEPHDHRAVPS